VSFSILPKQILTYPNEQNTTKQITDSMIKRNLYQHISSLIRASNSLTILIFSISYVPLLKSPVIRIFVSHKYYQL